MQRLKPLFFSSGITVLSSNLVGAKTVLAIGAVGAVFARWANDLPSISPATFAITDPQMAIYIGQAIASLSAKSGVRRASAINTTSDVDASAVFTLLALRALERIKPCLLIATESILYSNLVSTKAVFTGITLFARFAAARDFDLLPTFILSAVDFTINRCFRNTAAFSACTTVN